MDEVQVFETQIFFASCHEREKDTHIENIKYFKLRNMYPFTKSATRIRKTQVPESPVYFFFLPKGALRLQTHKTPAPEQSPQWNLQLYCIEMCKPDLQIPPEGLFEEHQEKFLQLVRTFK